ncbi:MAG: T9SS type A sorting domain-containing protein [Sphingobacteriaceae bacterium]|nr:MAG: T9SS type A sorting domain-containing protein [Sphingobacteriaceae bacterium]
MNSKLTFTTKAIALVLFLSAAAVNTLSAKLVVLNSNTTWSNITSGSGPGGVPNSTDDIQVFGTTGSGAVTLTIDVNAEAKSLQLGQVSQPRTGDVVINPGKIFNIYGNLDAQKPNNSKWNTVTFGSSTSQLNVYGINGAHYQTSPTTQTVNIVVPLPVDLISFNVNKLGNATAKLDFATAWEVNNRGFEVERSTNGVYWTNIGFVQGNGNANHIINYSFTTSLAGINSPVVYYRLKQVDFNGQFEYSAIRTIRLNNAAAKVESIYPNPAQNKVTVSLEGIAAGETATISIMDMAGKIVISAKQIAEEGNFSLDLNLDNLQRGNYIVNISSASVNSNAKLIKL